MVPADDPRVRRCLEQLAGWQLPGSQPIEPVADEDLGLAVVTAAVEHRLVGVLGVAIGSGQVQLPPGASTQALGSHREALTWCLRLEVELLRLVDELRAIDVDPIVLKGPATAHLDEADPSLRTFADLDLLVPGAAMDRTVSTLVARGGHRLWAQRRPGWDARFAKSVTLRTSDDIELDLHRSLCDGVHGFRIPLDALQQRSVTWDLAGTPVRALDPVHRLLHTAYHLVLGSPEPRLMSVRDLAHRLCDPAVDLDAVVAEARAWRGDAVLAAAVAHVQRLGIDVGPWAQWAASVQVSAKEAAVIERQRTEGSGLGRGKLDAMAELRWSLRPAYLAALVAPTGEHLRSRGLRRRDLVGRR